MKRTAWVLMLLAALGGCVSTDHGYSGGGGCSSCGGWGARTPTVPGMQGPWGEPVAMIPPYSAAPPGALAAQSMMAQSVPLDLVQTSAAMKPGMDSGIMRAGGQAGCQGPGCISPPGVPFQPVTPGVAPSGAVATAGAVTCPTPNRFANKRTEIRFVAPAGMRVSWFAPTPDGRAGFTTNYLSVPGRYNFLQAAVYRLKLSNIANRPGLELYPTLEVVPSNARTDPFLAHSSVPVAFTEEDFEQVAAGNFLIKVVYLPDPQYQDLATTGPDEVVSSRLEPGVDPIAEAHRRGNILLVVRMGNIDLEAANTPAMDSPNPYMPKQALGPSMPKTGVMPGMPPQGSMMPGNGMMPPSGSFPGATGISQPADPPPLKSPEPSLIEQTQYKVPAGPTAAARTADKKPAKWYSWWSTDSPK